MVGVGSLWRGLKSLFAIFPEREFHYRARGKVQYFSISGRTQFGLTLLIGLATRPTITASR
jgi:hypothetical protein